MFKDLLVPLIGYGGDAEAIELAVSLSRALGARLVVLTIVDLPTPMSAPWGVMQELGLADVYSALRAQGQRDAAALRERLGREPIDVDVRTVETLTEQPGRMAALCAHHADLVVVAGSIGTDGEADLVQGFIGSLLMASGTPVLMVPKGGARATLPPRRAVIAWKRTREATRAVHDALPLLQAAERVDLLLVDPDENGQPHGQPPGSDVAAHLAHHGVNVEVVVRTAGAGTVAAVVREHAATLRADLIVAGGYGHSRLREWALGGVTRELLGAASVPVLLSH